MASDQVPRLYVDGNVTPEICFSAETQCVFMAAAYCGHLNMDSTLVKHHQRSAESTQTGCMVIPEASFARTFEVNPEEVWAEAKACCLPTICTDNQVNVYSGLCTVLRYIIKRASQIATSGTEKAEIIRLLGHRMYCLKACSEVSSRTKLCETLMPSVINNSPSCYTQIPDPILEFENLLSQPVVIHNMDKRQRVLLKRLGNDEEAASVETNTRKRKMVVWTKDLPPLEHAFSEGVDFTLTDICVFPTIQYFLTHCDISHEDLHKSIPRTLKWYCRVRSIPRVQKAAQTLGISFVQMPNPLSPAISSRSNGTTEVIELKGRGDANKKINTKKELEMTIRRDLPGLLHKLASRGISADFMQFERNEVVIDWDNLPRESHPTEGELTTARARRKCHQIENLVKAVRQVTETGNKIVDFCCGGGHVGIILAQLFPKCDVVLVDNKEESLDRARTRIEKLNLKNIRVYQCNLEYYKGSFDVGVGLHACGAASDMIIQRCISQNASFVLSPCCYGKVANSHWISYPQSDLYKNAMVTFDEAILLGRAADQTTWDFDSEKAKTGKLCMGLLDLDRAHAAKKHGYQVQLYTMQPQTCSPKNNMLVGKARTSRVQS